MPVEQITAIKDGDKGFQINYYFNAQPNGQTTNAVTAKVEEANAATASGYAENNQTFADLEMTFWAMAFGYGGDLRQQF
ncbi:MAG: hypothetical protein QE278_00910 [Limnobacter sp.]|nr:hypothetical protein [Limnobacter sp.]